MGEGLKEASIESLVNYMVDSTEQDWKKHPSFYSAVLLEYRDRVNQVMSFIKLEDE